LQETFLQQWNLVNSVIVPIIMEVIDTDIFPIVDEVIYEIIHTIHRHRREEFLRQDLPTKKDQERKKHANTRRYDVSR